MTSYLKKKKKFPLSKQKELKKKGKGNRPNASIALTSDELNTLYEKGLLGTGNPEALWNTLCLDSTIHFGLRGCKEHRDMCWGDAKLYETADGKEYLEFNERQTKTKTGSDCRDTGQCRPKCLPLMGEKKILKWSTSSTPRRDLYLSFFLLLLCRFCSMPR